MPNAPPSSTLTHPAPLEPSVANGDKALGMASITDFAPADQSHQSPSEYRKTICADGDSATLRAAAEDCERRVNALLARSPDTKTLAAVQEQVKIALGVIDEALDKYRQVDSLPPCGIGSD